MLSTLSSMPECPSRGSIGTYIHRYIHRTNERFMTSKYFVLSSPAGDELSWLSPSLGLW